MFIKQIFYINFEFLNEKKVTNFDRFPFEAKCDCYNWFRFFKSNLSFESQHGLFPICLFERWKIDANFFK